MRTFFAALLTCCVSAAHDHGDGPASFRDTVQLILRSSRENLRPLKASRIEIHPRRDYWYEVTDVLPGARVCRIYEHPAMVYKCEWKAETDVSAAFARLVSDIGAVLGTEDWLPAPGARQMRFEPVNPLRNGVVEVRITGPARRSIIELLFFAVTRQ